MLTAVEEGAKVACLQKEATVSANGNGCSFVVKAHSNPAGIVRWRSDWARLNDWRINNELFNYYVEYAEEAVPWVISQGRSVGIEPIEFLTDSSIRYDDGGVVAVCDATQASNQDLMVALAQKAAEGGATFYYETPCVQLVQEEDGTVTGAIGKQKDGSYVKLNATKGVVLAAGDYMNNESMVDRNLRDAAMFPLCLVNHTGRRPHPRYSGGRPHGAPRPCAADPHQLHRPLYVLPLPGPRCPRQALLQRDHPHEQPEHLHVRHLQARGPRHPLPHFRL